MYLLPLLDLDLLARFRRGLWGLASLLPSCLLLLALAGRRDRLRFLAALVFSFIVDLEDLGTITVPSWARMQSASVSLCWTAKSNSAILAVASCAMATVCSFCFTLLRVAAKVEGATRAAPSAGSDGVDPSSVLVV